MEGRRIRKMENLVKPETTPAIVGNGIDSCHILHCIKWGNILPFMTRSPICYGNVKIVAIPLNRKNGLAFSENMSIMIDVGTMKGEPIQANLDNRKKLQKVKKKC